MIPPICIEISQLKQALAGLKKVVSNHRLPVLESIRISRSKEGEVMMQGTDLDSFAQYRIPTEVENNPVEFLVPIQHLSKVAKTCGTKEWIDMVYEGPEKVFFRTFVNGLGFEEQVETIPIEEWPPTPEVKSPSILLDDSFRKAWNEASECWSEEDSRRVINSVHLDVSDAKAHYLIATNGRVLFSANSFHFDLKESLIIPRSKFLQWNGWWQEQAQLSVQLIKETTWIQIQSGAWTFIIRQTEGPYPNWRQVVPNHKARATIQVPSEAIPKVLELLARIPGDYEPDYPIDLKVADNHLVLEGHHKGNTTGTSVTIREAEIAGKPVEVRMNRFFLTRALRFGLSKIEIKDGLSPVVFTNAGKRLIAMPLRPEQPHQAAPQKETPSEAKPQEEPVTTTNQTSETINERTSMAEKPQPTVTETIATNTLGKIEAIKETLRSVMSQCNDLVAAFKADAKEKKATEREIESVREKLQVIKSVEI